jgi:heme-degrading monooxygenase HmoA
MTPPVARLWRGRTKPANAHPYEEHLRTETLPALGALEGFRRAYVLKRVDDDDVAFVVVTLWDSLDAIHAFAGHDAEHAVIPAAAAAVLAEWDERAVHYEVALEYEAGQ